MRIRLKRLNISLQLCLELRKALPNQFSMPSKNIHVLQGIIDTIISFVVNTIYEDTNNNFKTLLEYQAKYKPVLRDHLENSDAIHFIRYTK